ncbi:MAG: tetratricopeptide repeat protein [Calditrichaeota bacterium]|nr:tetratricopeptide repeat protein [Calditrichota bacterium]
MLIIIMFLGSAVFAAGIIPQKLIDARGAERSKQFDKAIEIYKEVLKIDFTSKEAWQGIFRSQAAKEIKMLDAKLPENESHRLKGKIYLKYYQYSAAIDHFRKAYSSDKKNPTYFLDLISAYLQSGFTERGLKLLKNELKARSNNTDFLLKVADFCYQNRLYDLGADFYKQTIDKGVRADSIYMNYARCLENLGRLKDAEKVFSQGLKKSASGRLYTAFVRFYIRQNDFKKALKIAEKSKDEFNIVEAYLKLKGRKAVISFFEEKLKKSPNTLAYYIWIGELYSMEKDFDRAEKIIRKGLLRFSNNVQLWEMLTDLYIKNGRSKEALKIAKKRLPEDDANKKRMAKILIMRKDTTKANIIIKELLNKKSLRLADVAKFYENYYPQKARRLYNLALRKNPGDIAALKNYYKFLRKSRAFDEAGLLVEKGIKANPKWLEQDGVNLLKFLSLNGSGDVALRIAHDFILNNNNWQRITKPAVYQPYLTTLQLTGATREYFIFLELLLEFEPDNRHLYRQIAQLYEQNNNWKEALYYYKLLLKDKPTDAQRRYKVAIMYAKLDDRESGLKILRQTIEGQKRRPVDLYYLARYYYDLGYFEQALATVNYIVGQKIANQRNFDDPYGYVLKTLILEASGKLTEAQSTLEEYVRRFPDFPQSHQLLAEYLFRHGDFKGAENEYKTLFKLNPQNLTTLRRISLSLVYQNRLEEARKFLEEQIKASEFIPDEDIDYYKGYLAHLMNDYQEALKNYNKALKRNPKNSHLLFLRGLLLEEMGKYDEALKNYRQAMREDSTYARYDKLGDIYLQMHQYQKALNYYALYRNFQPEDLSVFSSIAECYKNLGNEDEIYTLIGMLQSYPESATRAYQEARLYELLENFVMASRNYLRSILLQSGVTPALRAIAQLYIKMGNFLEAEVWTRKYYEAAPQSPYNMDLMGVFYLESRDFVSAEYWFDKIIQTIPWYYYAKGNLGLVYLYTDDYKKAKEIFKNLSTEHTEQSSFKRNWALSAIRLKEFNEAEKIYKELLKEHPYNLKNYLDYARFLLQFRKKPKAARKIIERALKISPQDKDLRAFHYLLLAYEGKVKEAISNLLDLQTYYNDNNRYAQGILAMYLALAYERNKDQKTRDEYLAIAEKMYPNNFWIQESYRKRDINLKVVAISEKPEVIAAQQKQGLMDTFQKYEDRFTSLEINNRFRLSEISSEKVAEEVNKQAEFDVSIAPDHLRNNSSLKLIQAPKVIITYPKDGHHTRASSITVEGFITRGKKPTSLDLNGKPIKDTGPQLKLKKMPDFEIYPEAVPFKVTDFPLVPGANFLTVHARFKDGYETESTVRVGRIAKLLYAFETTPKKLRGANRWALIIAVGDYEDPAIPDLPSAEENVKAIRRLLSSEAGLAIPQNNILILALSTGIQPTYSAILDGIRTIARYVEPQDEVFIYFTGQGIITGEKSPQNIYLLTQDSQVDNLFGTAINFDLLYQTLKTVPSRMVSFFIDANFYKPDFKELSAQSDASSAVLNFSDKNEKPQINILSMGNGITKTRTKKNKPSFFTSLLVKALQGNADKNKDRKITFGEIYNYLKSRKQKRDFILGDFKRQTILFGFKNQ